MATLSDPTLGLLIEIGTDLFTGSDLRTMLMSSDLWKYARDEGNKQVNKQELVRSRLLGAQKAARLRDPFADDATPAVLRAQLDFVRELLNRSKPDSEDPAPWFGRLREALLADGYQVRCDSKVEETEPASFGWPREKIVVTYEVVPTDLTAVPLAPEISALEADLSDRGYTTALSHYRQAVDHLVHHHYESANSQVRAALEAVVVDVAKTQAGYVGQGKAGEGSQAIQHLVVTTGLLPEKEGGQMLRGLWQMSHTNGSHPGLSSADEARIRLQLVTATMRLLLNHFS